VVSVPPSADVEDESLSSSESPHEVAIIDRLSSPAMNRWRIGRCGMKPPPLRDVGNAREGALPSRDVVENQNFPCGSRRRHRRPVRPVLVRMTHD
jgi:hypothetical protein